MVGTWCIISPKSSLGVRCRKGRWKSDSVSAWHFFSDSPSSPSTTTSIASSPADPLLRLFLLAFALAVALPSAAIEPFVIRDIRVEGVQRTEAGTVFSYLTVKVGDRIDDDKAAAAVKALYATGFYSDVRLESEGDVLIVFVQERPAIAQIDIEGAKEFTKDNLKEGLKQTGISESKIYDK